MKKRKRQGFAALQSDRWIDSELARCEFKDPRHGKRLRKLVEQLSENLGGSIPWACQDWANTKAAYRFFSNERVSEEEILTGHLQATRDRLAGSGVLILMLHDTTEFTFHRNEVEPIGILHKSYMRKDKEGRPRHYPVCGILMHSSLAVTTEGLPLGLAAIKFWTRDQFKGCNALKKKINPTRVPIEQKESYRWLENVKQSTALFEDPQGCVHIGDRESDIYELFCTAQKAGTHFLLRTCVDRLAGDGDHTIADEMEEVRVQGLHRIQVRDRKGEVSEAVLEIRYRRIRVLPPIGKQKQYPELHLTILYAQERGTPQGREKLDWKLITDLPVRSREDAIEKLEWYAMRLVALIAVLCILSWRVFWMTMINRTEPDASPKVAFTELELWLLDELVEDKADADQHRKSLTAYLTKLARLGGYLARAHDPPPGNKVMWRGLSRLTDIELGAIIGAQLVGN
jgi:transposase-like protein